MAAAAAVEVKRSPGIPERTGPTPEARRSPGIPEDIKARVVEMPEVVTRIPASQRERFAEKIEEAATQVAALPTLGDPTERPAPAEVRRLPADFAERIAERVAAIPEAKRLPAVAREILAQRVADMMEPPDVRLGAPQTREIEAPESLPEGFADRVAARVADAPELRSIPPERAGVLAAKAAEAAARAAAVPELGEAADGQRPEVRALPDDFEARVAARVAALPEIKTIPARRRAAFVRTVSEAAERVAALPEPLDEARAPETRGVARAVARP